MSWEKLRRFCVVVSAALVIIGHTGSVQALPFHDPYDDPYDEEFLADPPVYRRAPPRTYAPPRYYYEPGPPRYRYEEAPQGPRTAAPQYQRQIVPNPTGQGPGTIVVDTRSKFLYLVLDRGRAIRYGVGVGRQGFTWKGTAVVGRKAVWPDWRPPEAMLQRQPYLPRHMPGGPGNPLGARALYLHKGGKDTLFRIHGTNERWSIGRSVSSGCIRMLNEDVIDLYGRVGIGTRVVVL